jgi:copper chaperone CopZ
MKKSWVGISLNKILMSLGALFFAAAIYRASDNPAIKTFLTRKIQTLQKAVRTDDSTPSKIIFLEVNGMTCSGCEANIKNALIKLRGVKKVEANFKQESATVTVNPQIVDTPILIETINQAGYRATQNTQKSSP